MIDRIKTYHHGTFTFLLVEIPLVYSYSQKSSSQTKDTESSKRDLYVLHFKKSAPIHSIKRYTKNFQHLDLNDNDWSTRKFLKVLLLLTHRSTTHGKIIPTKRLVFDSRINSQRKDDGGNGDENDDGGCYIGSFVFEDGW